MRSHVPTIVNKIIDTLDLRVSRNAAPSSWLLSECQRWREYQANWQPDSPPLLVKLDGLGVFRFFGSQKPYEFVLSHPEIADIRIWKPESWDKAVYGKTGQIFISYRSKLLQLLGIDAVLNVLNKVVALLVDATSGPVVVDWPRPDFTRVARGDLAVDVWQDRGFKLADLDYMVCQSRQTDVFNTLSDVSRKVLLERVLGGENQDTPPMDNKGVSIRMLEPGALERAAASVLDEFAGAVAAELEEGKRGASVSRLVMSSRRPQTVYFGRYTSPIFAKAYNKLGSLRVQKKLYMLDVWAKNGWDGSGHVWRWEWTFTGDFLKSLYIEGQKERFDIRELDTFLAFIPALWFYVTRKWLRQIVNPEARKNTDKTAVTEYWALIQSAWDGGVSLVRDHSRAIRIQDEDDRTRKILELEAQARGCLTTAEALKASNIQDVDKSARIIALEKQARGCLTSAEALKLSTEDTGNLQKHAGLLVDVESGEVYDLEARITESVKFWIDDDLDADILIRRHEVATDDFSDTALTSLYRAYRMAEGWGS